MQTKNESWEINFTNKDIIKLNNQLTKLLHKPS